MTAYCYYSPAYDYSDRLVALDWLARGQREDAEALLQHLRYVENEQALRGYATVGGCVLTSYSCKLEYPDA